VAVRTPTREERLKLSHRQEWAHGWQYGIVWRTAKATDTRVQDGPPSGEGWELNIDTHEDGLETRIPSWSDGSIVMHITHWRRSSPKSKASEIRVRERIKYDGDPHPY
jgi:hypothetical protein